VSHNDIKSIEKGQLDKVRKLNRSNSTPFDFNKYKSQTMELRVNL